MATLRDDPKASGTWVLSLAPETRDKLKSSARGVGCSLTEADVLRIERNLILRASPLLRALLDTVNDPFLWHVSPVHWHSSVEELEFHRAIVTIAHYLSNPDPSYAMVLDPRSSGALTDAVRSLKAASDYMRRHSEGVVKLAKRTARELRDHRRAKLRGKVSPYVKGFRRHHRPQVEYAALAALPEDLRFSDKARALAYVLEDLGYKDSGDYATRNKRYERACKVAYSSYGLPIPGKKKDKRRQ